MRETIESIRLLGFWRFLWARYAYRHVMRFSHRFNWHHTRHLGPFEDGTEQQWCEWCGLRHVYRRATPPAASPSDTTEGER